ncbi:methyltransferase family protein [Tessaracoccus sp. G1721]
MRKYLHWAGRRPSTAQLVGTLALAGALILAGIPLLIAVAGRWLDRTLGLPPFDGWVSTTAGVALMVVGLPYAFWAVLAEARIGGGTPVPTIPTQRLVVEPPFTYCRNPMVLGTAVGYLGFGVWLGSVSAIALVLVFSALLLIYVKVLEEGELEARFGADYLRYKQTTPFLVPRFRTPPAQRPRGMT